MANACETTLAVSYYFNLISYCKDFVHGGILSVIFFMSYMKNVRFTDMWYNFFHYFPNSVLPISFLHNEVSSTVCRICLPI